MKLIEDPLNQDSS